MEDLKPQDYILQVLGIILSIVSLANVYRRHIYIYIYIYIYILQELVLSEELGHF